MPTQRIGPSQYLFDRKLKEPIVLADDQYMLYVDYMRDNGFDTHLLGDSVIRIVDDASGKLDTHQHTYITIYGANLFGATVPAASTYYSAPFGNSLFSSLGPWAWPVPFAMHLSNFRVKLSGAQPSDGALTIQLLTTGAPSGIQVVCPASGNNLLLVDSTDEAWVGAGARMAFSFINASPTGASAGIGGMLFEGDLFASLPVDL